MSTRSWLLACLLLPPLAGHCAEFFTGLHVSSPLAFSGSAGLKLGGANHVGSSPVIEVEAGIGGNKILLGFDSMGAGKGLGYGIKASLLNTWFEPIRLEDGLTYLGVELAAGVHQFIGTLGGYRLIEGDDEEWIASVGLGLRF
jgi:hypothetical protein